MDERAVGLDVDDAEQLVAAEQRDARTAVELDDREACTATALFREPDEQPRTRVRAVQHLASGPRDTAAVGPRLRIAEHLG